MADEICSEAGCEKLAKARGLCSMHYQRKRRAGVQGDKPGPQPRYSREISRKYQGLPSLSVRMELELKEWVKEHGGAPFLRNAADQLRDLENDPEFQPWWDRFEVDRD